MCLKGERALEGVTKGERSIFLMHPIRVLLTAAEFHFDFINEGIAPQMLEAAYCLCRIMSALMQEDKCMVKL